MTIPDELKTLYPSRHDEELADAKENLDRYLLLAWEIMEDQEQMDSPVDESGIPAYDPDKGRFPTNQLPKS